MLYFVLVIGILSNEDDEEEEEEEEEEILVFCITFE